MKSGNKKQAIKTESSIIQFKHLKPLAASSLKNLSTQSFGRHSQVKQKRRYDATLFHKTSFLMKPLPENPELYIHSQSLNKKQFQALKKWKAMDRRAIIPNSVTVKLGLNFMNDRQKLLNQDTFTHVTASKWLVYNVQQQTIVKGYKYRLVHDAVSLSSLMIFWTIYEIIKKEYIGIGSFQILIRGRDSRIGKNNFPLEEDSLMTIQDALHTVLITSSSAISLALANNIGYFLISKNRGNYFNTFDLTQNNREENIIYFIKTMNNNVKLLNLKDTSFTYLHGLICNMSSALDIARLQSACFKIPLYSKILSVKKYTTRVRYISQEGVIIKLHLIESNNKLFDKGCIGGNIGNSKTSGQCFVGLFEGNFIVVVLGCSGKEQKFADCMRLVKWVHNKLKFSQKS